VWGGSETPAKCRKWFCPIQYSITVVWMMDARDFFIDAIASRIYHFFNITIPNQEKSIHCALERMFTFTWKRFKATPASIRIISVYKCRTIET
jgi:hypothetical protein